MPNKRLIEAGHLVAIVFVALLLLGAHAFLAAHPAMAAVLLAAFVPAYYLAARTTGQREFLYPAVLLLVLAYQLLLRAVGLPDPWQPLGAVLPLALIYLAARAGTLRAIAGARASLQGSAYLVITAFTAWILVSLTWFYEQAPVAVCLALLGYAFVLWLRFRETEAPAHASSILLLGSGGFLFLLYSHDQVALFTAASLWLLLAGRFSRDILPLPESVGFLLAGIYMLLRATIPGRDDHLALGLLVLAALWLLFALRHRHQQLPLLGPHPALLAGLTPFFAAATLLALVPAALFYPWRPVTLVAGYLAVAYLVFFAGALELTGHAASLLGLGLMRILSAEARLAPLALLVYLAYHRFPPSYSLALAALAVAFLSLLSGWRQRPRVLVRRNVDVYQAAAFFTVAYFLAERRSAPVGALGLLLDSGALLLLLFLTAGYVLQRHAPHAYVQPLWDIAWLPAAAGCVIYALRDPSAVVPALLMGVVLLLASVLGLWKVRVPSVLYALPVVLGFWTYVLAWSLGVRGEALGLPYFVYGVIAAAIGYELLRRGNRWHELFYFIWFLCAGVSLVLFYPYLAIGSYVAPLWPLAFLLVAYGAACRSDFPFALVLEMVSGVLAAAGLAWLIWDGLYIPAAVAALLYTLLYGHVAVRRRMWAYLYPCAMCFAGASFLVVLNYAGALLFLPYLFLIAALFYGLGTQLRRRNLGGQAAPFELAASLGAVAGAALFLGFPFGRMVAAGGVTGIAYLALFLLLLRYSGEKAYVAGAALAGAFAIYQGLPALAVVTAANRLAVFIPVSLLLVLLGRVQHQRSDRRAAWSLYVSAIVVAALASFFALWPTPISLTASRLVLFVTMVVWVALLFWTQMEIFIYCATLGLAMLAYNFVQSSADIFGQHLVTFFLDGTILLGLVFLTEAIRKWLPFREPLRLAPPAHRYRSSLYALPVTILAVATFGSWGVSTSSNPRFCGTCHDMGGYYANWKHSSHAQAGVACSTCHYEPGLRGYMRAKIRGASELAITLTGTQTTKPVARVNDSNCLTSGCHSIKTLPARLQIAGAYHFEHARHLGTMARGPELRCTSCHTDVGTESHFAVDTNACFTCHFQTASDLRPVTVGCVGCHALPSGVGRADGFDHVAAGITAEDAACASCHEKVVTGSSAVERRNCRHCHAESVTTLQAAGRDEVHRRHVAGQGVACDQCHGVVWHGRSDKVTGTR